VGAGSVFTHGEALLGLTMPQCASINSSLPRACRRRRRRRRRLVKPRPVPLPPRISMYPLSVRVGRAG
jgi:hypothetical protein